jgi:hypothetical protein
VLFFFLSVMMPVGPHSCCRLSGEPRTVRTHTEQQHTALRSNYLYLVLCACAAGNQSTIAHHPTCNSEPDSHRLDFICVWILRCREQGVDFGSGAIYEFPQSAARCTPCSVFFIAPPGEFSHFPLRLWAVNSHFARFHMCQAAARARFLRGIERRSFDAEVHKRARGCSSKSLQERFVCTRFWKPAGKVILWPKKGRMAHWRLKRM